MASKELHFSGISSFWKYEADLQQLFSTKCSNQNGKTCSNVRLVTIPITEDVDNGNFSEEEGREMASKAARVIDSNCKYGLGRTGMCGIGVLCDFSDEWQIKK